MPPPRRKAESPATLPTVDPARQQGADILRYVAGDPVHAIEYGSSIYVRTDDPGRSTIFARLRVEPFAAERAIGLSLVPDSATNEELAQAFVDPSAASGCGGRTSTRFNDLTHAGPAEVLRLVGSAEAGAPVVVVGHVEDGAFVVRDEKNALRWRVAISELIAAAQKSGARLLPIGCLSAEYSPSFGVATALNSYEFAQRFVSAARTEVTWLGVLGQIAGTRGGNDARKIPIVVGSALLRREPDADHANESHLVVYVVGVTASPPAPAIDCSCRAAGRPAAPVPGALMTIATGVAVTTRRRARRDRRGS